MGCFRDIIKHSIQKKKSLAIIIVLCILIASCFVLRNYYIGLIVQNLQINDLTKYGGVTILSFLFHIFLCLEINKEVINYNENVFTRFSQLFFRLDFKEILKYNESIMSDMNESLQNISLACNTGYTLFLQQLILIIITICLFLYYLPSVGIIIIVALVGIYYLQRYNLRILRNKWDIYWDEYVKFNKLYQDVMLNIWSVKYNTLENITDKYLQDKFKKRMESLRSFLNNKIIAVDSPDFTFFVVILFNLYSLIKNKQIKTSIRVLLILQSLKIWKEFHILCYSSTELYQNIKYIEKICPIWILKEKEIFNEKDIKVDMINNIEFNNVTYSYVKNKNILNKMSFKINKGETVSLVGKSGSGKSTIINLMCRLYDIEDNNGGIKINNNDIKNIDIKSLRECITVVPQNFNVFDMTIKENILLEDKYDEDKFNFVVKLLNLPDMNLDAKTLSHGQKQRVIIARTLYRQNKSVYIFDEYLSAVDQERSNIIHSYVLDYIKKNKKIGIFISHNPERTYSTNKIIKL
jgi:ABC-type multidrug transport system fused ATPase/permease subunit